MSRNSKIATAVNFSIAFSLLAYGEMRRSTSGIHRSVFARWFVWCGCTKDIKRDWRIASDWLPRAFSPEALRGIKYYTTLCLRFSVSRVTLHSTVSRVLCFSLEENSMRMKRNILAAAAAAVAFTSVTVNAATPAEWRSRSIYQVLTDRWGILL